MNELTNETIDLGMLILTLSVAFLVSFSIILIIENFHNKIDIIISIKENEELKEKISELNSKISELYQEDRHRRNLDLFKRKNPNFEGYLMIGFSQKAYHCESDEKYIIDNFTTYVLEEDLILKTSKQSKKKREV